MEWLYWLKWEVVIERRGKWWTNDKVRSIVWCRQLVYHLPSLSISTTCFHHLYCSIFSLTSLASACISISIISTQIYIYSTPVPLWLLRVGWNSMTFQEHVPLKMFLIASLAIPYHDLQRWDHKYCIIILSWDLLKTLDSSPKLPEQGRSRRLETPIFLHLNLCWIIDSSQCTWFLKHTIDTFN